MTLEELLNKLIEKGRVPFGTYGNGDLEGERICIEEHTDYSNEYRNKIYYINVDYVEFNGLCDEDKQFFDKFSLREIVSKGSGLWQFVCEKGMVKGNGQYESSAWIRAYEDERDSEEYTSEYGASTAEYYLLESSLKDESELEEFLLKNIKVEGLSEK